MSTNTTYDGSYSSQGNMFLGSNIAANQVFIGTAQRIDLPVAHRAIFGSYIDQHEPQCLAGTRTNLLDLIRKWASDPLGKPMFWLNGMAGTGKSTISRTVAQELQRNSILGASFFFRRGESDRGTGTIFFTTIAVQLANRFNSMASSIRTAINEDNGVSKKGLKDQFDKLIWGPLSEIEPTSTVKPQSIIVVDALDECEQQDDIRAIVQLLSQLKTITTVDIRVFLTSRPDLPVRLGFKNLEESVYQDLVLHKVPEVKQDMSLFIRHEFSKIRANNCLGEDWPGEESIQALVEMAVPLFIYAATLCRFIGSDAWDPQERTKTVLEYKNDWEASHLNKIYLPILNHMLADQDNAESERLVREFQQIVGTIVSLANPLSISSLAKLLSVSVNIVNSRLKPLHSVLDVPEDFHTPVRTLHLSFRDFLLNRDLQWKSQFWVGEEGAHRFITSKCFELMSSQLKRNICNLKSPSAGRLDVDQEVLEERLPSELQYACMYWVHHLIRSKDRLTDSSQTLEFLQKNILFWLEALSLLGKIPDIAPTFDSIETVIDIEKGQKISTLISDAKRFVFLNQDIIHSAPLQLYSLLMFVPTKSVLRELLNPQKILQSIHGFPQVQEEWDCLLGTLSLIGGVFTTMLLSNDDKFLAAVSGIFINVWSVKKGALLYTLTQHSWIRTAIFSPDSKLLASASGDCLTIWDTSNGMTLRTLSLDSSVPVASIAFTLDCRNIMSASTSGVIEKWEMGTGLQLSTQEPHASVGESRLFSPDSKLLLSQAMDGSYSISDVNTGLLLQAFKGQKSLSSALTFSPNSTFFASADVGGIVRLWDVNTGFLLQVLEVGQSTDVIITMVFSCTKQHLALGSSDGKIWIWYLDANNPSSLALLGHTRSVTALAFSPNGRILVSGSKDLTIRVWNTNTGAFLKVLEGQHWGVEALLISSDSRLLASGGDRISMLWDLQVISGNPQKTLLPPPPKAQTAAFSRDGSLFAVSDDSTIEVWHAGTRSIWQKLESHADSIAALAFSSDSKHLAAASGDRTINLWSLKSDVARPPRTLKGFASEINLIEFSPDDTMLASVSGYETVVLWNVSTGIGTPLEPKATRGGLYYGSTSLGFSPDGRFLALIYYSEIAQIWDIYAMAPLHRVVRDTVTFSLSFPMFHQRYKTKPYTFPCRLPFEFLTEKSWNSNRINFSEGWLTRGGQRLLWFPHMYQPSCFAAHGDLIGVVFPSGDVSFVGLHSLPNF
ncbi:hypothetical protein ABW19_dt0209418 [Dactylella cylindrospora]|nr:hypothetical protein ABW19_dt0209418 [Dactylella cylindrospora]